MAESKPKVLVLGHSFVSRLDAAFRRGNPRLIMDLWQFEVRMHGRGGATALDTLCYDVLPRDSVVQRFAPSVVVLQVGGNCLCRHEASEVGEHMMRLVRTLLGFAFVRRVVVLQIFPRRRTRYISAEVYEERREELNAFLAVRLSMPDLRRTTLSWDHLRLKESPLAIFDRDGVHLSRTIGMPKYWRVVRGAIIHGAAL